MDVRLTACLLLACKYIYVVNLTVSNGDVECPSWDGELYFIADPVDCTKYYACTPSGPCHYTCPSDLWWDTELNICNWSDEVDCAGKYFARSTNAILY